MNRKILLTNAMVFLLGVYFVPASAQLSPPIKVNPYGTIDVTIGCDITGNGLEVTHLDEAHRIKVRDHFDIDVNLGDPCLPALAKFPPPLRKPPIISKLSIGDGATANAGEDTEVEECLIWIIAGPNVGESTRPVDRRLIACDADGAGGLEIAFVNDSIHGEITVEAPSCGIARSYLTPKGAEVIGPVSASLRSSTGEPAGSLMWVGTAPDTAEVLICELEEENNHLVVAYQEDKDGINETAVGQSCLATLGERESANDNIQFVGPIPFTKIDTETSSIIWEINTEASHNLIEAVLLGAAVND